ncbi:MAG: sulfatase [bacterium]|nr:sulfatase [bacterium]
MKIHAARTQMLLALACATASACGRTDAPPPNVLLICMDTVRADHLGCYGYERRETTPTLDRLAERGYVFADTSATAGWTKPSVPTILTGLYPAQHGVYQGSSKDADGMHSDVVPKGARTLAEAFAATGYETAAFVMNAQLRRGLGFEQGFDVYADGAGDAREIRWRARDWLDERAGDEPFFLYLHFLDAHWPYPVPDEYATLFTDGADVERFRGKDWRELRDAVNHGREQLSDADLEVLLALYDGAIRYIDDELGRLMDHLERSGLAEDTIVCVVSDHGEEFLEHGRIGHGHGLYENLLSVPWILHVPGRGAGRVETPCSLVDLFPTLLHAAGVSDVGAVPGVDRLADPHAVQAAFAEHLEPGSYSQSLRRGQDKLVRVVRPDSDATGTKRTKLDPGVRVEAKLERDASGGVSVAVLRPSSKPPGDPTELKGPAELKDGALRVHGVPVVLGPGVRYYGDGASADGPREGALVKAVGRVEDGRLIASKLKMYAPDAELEREVRGRLDALDAQIVHIDGLGLACDARTEIEAPRARRRLRRADLLGLVPGAGFVELTSAFDLDADPHELAPRSGVPSEAPRELGERLFADRLWTEGDQRALGAREVEDLQAIGYAGED